MDSFSQKPVGAQALGSDPKKADPIEKILLERLLKLPILARPVGNYRPALKAGKQLYLSGQLPLIDNSLRNFTGRLGREISLEAGQKAAQICTLNALAWVKQELGGLDKVKQVIKLTGYVSGMPGFKDQAKVLNGASELLVALYGEAGRHTRSAVGVTDLPLGACVEIEYLFEVK
ncbi:MAG: RidA family protein [Deltaproteobacteria bacterium]|nr:RidA family protein [Deltaproteobacteria bacterium]